MPNQTVYPTKSYFSLKTIPPPFINKPYLILIASPPRHVLICIRSLEQAVTRVIVVKRLAPSSNDSKTIPNSNYANQITTNKPAIHFPLRPLYPMTLFLKINGPYTILVNNPLA
jgi:hypothetical protein